MHKAIKITLAIILIPVGLFVLLLMYLGAVAAEDQRQQDKVTVEVAYNIEACSSEFPLRVTTQNGSDKTVSFIDFGIDVRRKGYSSDLSSYIDYDSDKILAPGESHSRCWKYKLSPGNERYDVPADLEFVISYKRAQFQR